MKQRKAKKITYNTKDWELGDWAYRLTDLVRVPSRKNGHLPLRVKVKVGKAFDRELKKIIKEAIEVFINGCGPSLFVGDDGFRFGDECMSEEFFVSWFNLSPEHGSGDGIKKAFDNWYRENYEDAASDFAKLDDIKAGDKLRADDGFDCLLSDRIVEVKDDGDGRGLYFNCEKGKHRLEGQRGRHDECVGMKKVVEE